MAFKYPVLKSQLPELTAAAKQYCATKESHPSFGRKHSTYSNWNAVFLSPLLSMQCGTLQDTSELSIDDQLGQVSRGPRCRPGHERAGAKFWQTMVSPTVHTTDISHILVQQFVTRARACRSNCICVLVQTMFARQYCPSRAAAEAAAPGKLKPWSRKQWFFDCGVPPLKPVPSAHFAAAGVTLLDAVALADVAHLLDSVLSFPAGHSSGTVVRTYTAAVAPASSATRFTSTLYRRATTTTGYFVLLHQVGCGSSSLFAGRLRVFAVSCGCPLLVVEPLTIIQRPYGFVVADITQQQQQQLVALPWTDELRVSHCAATVHSPNTVSLMPADCLPNFLFGDSHASEVAANHAAGSVPIPPRGAGMAGRYGGEFGTDIQPRPLEYQCRYPQSNIATGITVGTAVVAWRPENTKDALPGAWCKGEVTKLNKAAFGINWDVSQWRGAGCVLYRSAKLAWASYGCEGKGSWFITN